MSDYVEGLTLADWLIGQQLTSRTAAELSLKLAEALHHAHEQGIIHRDLKPTNIMLDRDNEPHIMDFGLAKREAGDITMTMEGKLLGTPAHMSPEQAKGEAHQADRRSDVYSLGVILYEMLTGHKPFRGNVRMLLQQVINDDPPSLRRLNSSIPRDLETLCLKCLEKDPRKRYPTASALAEELNRFVRGEPVKAWPITVPGRGWRWCKRNPLVAGLGAVLATVLLTLAIVGPAVGIRQAELAEDERNARQDAEQKSRELEQQLRISAATRLAAQAQTIRDELPVQSLLLAVEAVEATRRHDGSVMPLAQEALLSTIPNVGGLPLVRHEGRVYSLPMSADGRWLVAVGGQESGQAHLMDLAAHDPASSSHLLKGHRGRIWAADMSADGHWLATGSWDRTARVWDLTDLDPEASPMVLLGDRGINSLAISPDERWLLTGGWGHTARLWDLFAPDPTTSFHVLPGHQGPIPVVAISPNGRWAVTGSSDNTARLWDLSLIEKDPASAWTELRHEGAVQAVAISPNNHWLATGSDDKTVRLWDLNAEDPAHSPRILQGHEAGISRKALVISSDNRWVVSGSNDATARVWDFNADNPSASHHVLRGHEDLVRAVAISPDARWVVTGSGDSTARVWDLRAKDSAASAVVLRGHEDTVNTLAISPKDGWLVTGGWDGTVRLWNLSRENPASLLTLRGHEDTVADVAASPDGHWLVTASVDGTIVSFREACRICDGQSASLVVFHLTVEDGPCRPASVPKCQHASHVLVTVSPPGEKRVDRVSEFRSRCGSPL